MLTILFFLSNIIISILVEKISKVITIVHSIFFIIFLFISSFIGDLVPLTNFVKTWIGLDAFNLFKDALTNTDGELGVSYSVLSLIGITNSLCLITGFIIFTCVTFKFIMKHPVMYLTRMLSNKTFTLKNKIKDVILHVNYRYLNFMRIRI